MELQTLFAASAGLTAALAFMGVLTLVRSPRVQLRERIAMVHQQSPYVVHRQDMLRDRRASRFFLLDAWLQRREWTATTQLRLERAGLRLRVGEYVMLRGFMATAIGLTATLIAFRFGAGQFAIGGLVLGALAGVMLPSMFVKWKITRRNEKLESQLVEMCELMSSMLTAGFGYLQTLSSVAQQLEAPLAEEVGRLVDAVRIGGDTDEALETMTQRLGSRDFEMISTAISINRATGGDLAGILRGVGSTIRDRQSFAREVRALTSRERFSAIIVAGFPFIIVGALTLMIPDMFGVLFTDLAGRLILAGAATMDIVGYMAIKHVSKIEV
jgi:tight adherence protein B